MQSYGISKTLASGMGGNRHSNNLTLVFSMFCSLFPPIFHSIGWKSNVLQDRL